MKRNFFTRVMKSLFITLTVLGIGHAAFAVDIVGFTLGSGTAGAATSGVAINFPGMGRTLTAVGLTSTGYSSNGLTGAGWDNNGSDGFATNAFSTEGYLATAVTGQIRGTSLSGPKNLKAQYSLDGTNWVDVPDHPTYTDDNPNLVITASFASFKFRLPAECDNKTSVYVRWIMDGTNAITSGTVTALGTISMKAVVMQSELLSYPTSQSTQITIVSLTPTTITIGCTPGSGNRRYIAINTTNSFTTPTDDYLPSANTTYSGAGEQVIYVGSGTVATVTIPSSLNTYWFRYYEFNQLNTLTRYCTVDATLSKNPKICALPNIHTPTHSFGLTRATLGATINPVSGDVGVIMDRGVFWDINPGITNNTPNFVQHASAASGTFTINTVVDRGSVIYYRGYAENESGVILTSESNFDNTPTFTGTGTWETAARWNVQEVPGENGDATYGSVDDSPIIDGTCTLAVDNSVTNLTINSGRILNINADIGLTVNGTLDNNGGTAGLKLLSTSNGTGSLIHNSANVDATVERHITGSTALNGALKYHQVSVPLSSQEGYPSPGNYESSIWTHSYLFTYDAASNNWDNWDYETNDPCPFNKGYLIYHPDWKPGISQPDTIYIMKGKLNIGSYSPPVTNGGNGFNLIPNPYPSSINWNASSGWSFNAMSSAIWLYNATTNNYATVLRTGNGSIASGTGTSSAIQVGQAFFVKATGSSPTVSMNDNVRIHNSSQGFLKNSDAIANSLRLNIEGNSSADEILVNFAFDATTGYDSQYDAEKFTGPETSPQLSALNVSNDKYSIIGLPLSSDETMLPLNLNMNYSGELAFTASQLESFTTETSIKLEDKQLAKTIDLRSTPTYSFTHTTDDADDRFVLHFGSVLGFDDNHALLTSSVTVNGKQISVSYPITSNKKHLSASIFDTQGRLLKQVSLNGTGNDSFTLSETSGVYLLRLTLPSGNETHKIVVL
jgi:hypothetical protein